MDLSFNVAKLSTCLHIVCRYLAVDKLSRIPPNLTAQVDSNCSPFIHLTLMNLPNLLYVFSYQPRSALLF